MAKLLSDPDVTLRLARLDPDGSIVQDPTTYRPSASVRRRVRSRDGGCRFPGCYTPARNTDLDHVIAFPHGPTDPANLVCLCRTHHGFKHHGGWTLSLAADGTATWRAPDGRSWVTEPRPHGIREDLRLTADLDADRLHDIGRGWLPGLPVGMTPADLITAERCLPDDPPESPHTPGAPPDWAALDDTGSDARSHSARSHSARARRAGPRSTRPHRPGTATRSRPQPSKVTSKVCWPWLRDSRPPDFPAPYA